MVGDLVLRTWYVGNAYVKIIGSGREIKGSDEGHKVGASARSLAPDVDDCCVVAMEEDTSPLPGGAPGSAGDEDGIHLPPGNGVVAEVWGPWLTEPAVSPEAPIAEIGGVGCKLHIWGQRPVRLEEEAGTRPCGEEVKPPVQVSLGLLVKSDVVMQASNRGAEIDQAAQEDSPRRDDLAGEGQLADEREEGALGACTCVSEGAERVEEFLFSV